MLKFKSILHPTDFSDSARAAFDLACSLARDHGAELVVLHTRPVQTVATEGGVVVNVDQPLSPLLEELREAHPAPEGVEVVHKVLEGDDAGRILGEAESGQVDLIVMGTHGRTGLSRVLLGSVAEEVSRSATCPVLTVKSPIQHRG